MTHVTPPQSPPAPPGPISSHIDLTGLALTAALTLLALIAAPAYADGPRTPSEATAHALEELANAIAQGKVTRTPTPAAPTLAATATLSPTPTATSSPTDTPTPEPTATPTLEQPCWLTDEDLGDPDGGYVVFDQDGAPVPCPEPIEAPTVEPAPTVVRPTATSTPVPPPTPRAVPQAAPQQPLPTYTPYPTYTPQPTYTALPLPSATLTPTRAATATRTPPATATLVATATVTSTPLPPVVATRPASAQPSGHWEWAAFLSYLAAAIGIAVLVMAFLARRRVAVWKGQPHA
jgi:hypothetical protein